MLGLFIFVPLANSSVIVYSYTDNNEVIFITEKDNVVISDEDMDKIEMTVFPNDIEFYDLTEQYSDYKVAGKKFILNTKKISGREDEKVKDKEKKDKKDADFESAKVKLMSETWTALTSDECDSLK